MSAAARRGLAGLGLICAGLALASCARLACEWRWRTEMAPRLAPARDADAATRRDLEAGRAAFKQDFLEACAGG
ncbi:hypothetical protein [Nitrospira calida]|jgi:hypothetical protein